MTEKPQEAKYSSPIEIAQTNKRRLCNAKSILITIGLLSVGVAVFCFIFFSRTSEETTSKPTNCPVGHCKNGGTCVSTEGDFKCNCTVYWHGDQCDYDVDECGCNHTYCDERDEEVWENPCGDHGQCRNTFGSFVCKCKDGWAGKLCDQADDNLFPALKFESKPITDSAKIVTAKNSDYTLNFREVLSGWKNSKIFNQIFQNFFKDLARDDPDFRHVFFELPPLTKQTWENPFEFIVIAAHAFKNKKPSYDTFASNYNLPQCKGSTACNFKNKSGKSDLIVPKGNNNKNNDRYKDLMSFMIKASENEVNDLFQKVGDLSTKKIANNPDKPLWISTHGLGVIWLHVRLDSKPIYYDWKPYKNADFTTKDKPTNCPVGYCKNGGTCVSTEGKYKCDCTVYWYGDQCDYDVDECGCNHNYCDERDEEVWENPCGDHGQCRNTFGSFACKCKEGWTGETCDRVVDNN